MANLDSLRILGFGNPLLDISAVVGQDVLDECAPELLDRDARSAFVVP